MEDLNMDVSVRHLSELKEGESGYITKVLGHGSYRKRITDMGFVKGKKVSVIKNAPLQDPIEYEIMNYNISLRRSEADMIEVISKATSSINNNEPLLLEADEQFYNTAIEHSNNINVALIGNPNSGKTTLYNFVSGANEKVGNYAGVTVDAKATSFKKDGYKFRIVDLPGTYSLTEFSAEEIYVRNYITENTPDVIINVVDATNLERNLYLTTQLIDMNIKVVIALTMYDELERNKIKFDYENLGKMLGIPIMPVTANRGKGITELMQKVIDVYEGRDTTVRHIHINYGNSVEKSITNIKKFIITNPDISAKYCIRNLIIKLLVGDKYTQNLLSDFPNYEKTIKQTQLEITALENEFKEQVDTTISDARYGFINGALKETLTQSANENANLRRSKMIDNVLTNRIVGLPIFIFFMWLIFQTTFTLGSYPMDWIDAGVGLLGEFVSNNIPDSMFRDLLIDGIIGGVGGVIVFLPNIIILFFFISLMEDTGYMSRASFIMDKVMHKFGLHGKSFIPLFMGFGCSVPAIMASRTLENKRDRILTILMIPFMSCSARLPVYLLLVSAFFPSYQGLVLVSVYIVGVLIGAITIKILQKTLMKTSDAPFVLELPPYRVPTLKNTLIRMWINVVQYLKKMGGVILIASIILWTLSYFPRNDKAEITAQKTDLTSLNITNKNITDNAPATTDINITTDTEYEQFTNSYIARLGKFIEPIIKPLGFDWKIGISILTGLGAKEIIVSSFGILEQTTDDEFSVATKLKNNPTWSPLVAYCLMLFVLLYIPCAATIMAIKKEIGLKWAIFSVFNTTLTAWLVCFIVYQVGSLIV